MCVTLAASLVMLGGCVMLDRHTPRVETSALTTAESNDTTLGRRWAAAAPADPQLSAFRVLPSSLEAFAARVAMIDAAERTLDLQYYIFSSDDTGLFIIDRLVAAADRGVRVRLLIDDMYARGVEKGLAAFDAHPNIELRIFNPWTQRSGGLARGIEFLFTPRLNHRMHNKMLIADGVVVILGGRNIADEYFDLGSEFVFKDLDVAAAGPVAAASSQLFDAFWNGPDAIPITGLKPMPDFASMLEGAKTRLQEHRESMKDSPYADAVRATVFAQQVGSKSVQWVFAKGRIVGDAPEKTTKAGDPEWTQSLAAEVKDEFFSATRELLVSSPYFVPGKPATAHLCEVAAGGASVCILTNSLAASDVPLVHSHYSKYRKKLVEGGVELFELRRRSAPDAKSEDAGRAFGSANASLHAKSFVVDRERVFIGSLNLDARSVVLNTEVGVMIESPVIAESVAKSMKMLMAPQWSFRVMMDDGDLIWIGEDADGNEVRDTVEPDTTGWQRFKTKIMGILPIEGQV